MKTTFLALSVTALTAWSTFGCGSYTDTSLGRLAQQAISENPTEAAAAITALREHGDNGLQALLNIRDSISPNPEKDPAFARLRKALDEVGQQRDCHASGLYWYTDMEKAKAAARERSKPILSLRLLGKLNEELSCANSRFFRTTLYANAEVSKYLRDHFVLHWQSVRPAPRVTIDFGDGRKLERTITGNSIHYVLDAEGNTIDALPGLYGPKAFLAGLSRAEEAARGVINLNLAAEQRKEFLGKYHRDRLAAIASDWAADLAKLGQPVPEPLPQLVSFGGKGAPPAKAAARIAIGKSAVEMPLLRAIEVTAAEQWRSLKDSATDSLWPKLAALHSHDAKLDNASRQLIAAKNPNAWQAGRLAESKMRVEDPMLRLLRNLEGSIAEDTVRNEYLLHAQIHQWFAEGKQPAAVEALNAKVYAELFLTPNSDPWLGLVGNDAYTALENDGIVTALVPRPNASGN